MNLKDILQGKVYTDKDRPPFQVKEDLSKQGFAELKGQARYLAGSVKDLVKGIQQKNDDVIESELDYIISKSKLMKDMLSDKRYNESLDERQKHDSENLVIEFGKSFQKFTRAVHMLGKSMTNITGERTDEKIIQKAFKKHIIPFGRLIDSWNETQQKNPHLNEGRYHAWRNDDSMTPKQKIGMAMRETRDNLTELERVVKYNVKLKNELNVDSRSYWKNTHKALSKISERLVNLANKVGQLH